MGINVTKARMPVKFELTDDNDSRFKKVKVWIAHTGENLNNSYFSKDVLEEMSKTLPKVPIVGYIEINDESEEDFSDHRQEITVKAGEGVKIRYAGHAYGFLPDDCNAQFELRDGKEWLTAEGYVWTKFKDSLNIFNESNGVKSHSMEIEQAEGEVDDIGRMEITSAVFSALCILGEDVPPAMTGSTIEFFSDKKNQYQFELDEMIKEFEKEKGDLNLKDELETEIVSEEATTETDQTSEGNQEAVVVENPDTSDEFAKKGEEEEEGTDSKKESDKGSEEDEEDEEDEADEKDEKEKKKLFSIEENTVSINFQLSHNDQRNALYSKLADSLEHGYHYIMEMYNDNAIVEKVTYDEDYETSKRQMVKINFTIENDELTIGEETEVFSMFLTKAEKELVDSQRVEIEQLSSRLNELNEYKEASEMKDKEEIVEKYSEDLGEEVVKDIKANFSVLTVEDVEKEVALQFFKKAQAEKEVESNVSVGVANFSKNGSQAKKPKYGTLDKFFQ